MLQIMIVSLHKYSLTGVSRLLAYTSCTGFHQWALCPVRSVASGFPLPRIPIHSIQKFYWLKTAADATPRKSQTRSSTLFTTSNSPYY